MKRILSLFLCFLFLPMIGCQEEETPLQNPITVYYRRAEITSESSDSVIASLEIEGAGYEHDPTALLNFYLRGPIDPEFVNPFPFRTEVLEMKIENNAADLLMNPSMSKLSGIDLSVACACLTKTVMALHGVQSVTIRVRGGTLDGADAITMDSDVLHLLDELQP